MNIFRKRLGIIIKKYRLYNDLSQEKLGEMTSLHRTYISDVERGKRNISINNLYKISKALNIYLYILIKKAESIEQ